MQPGPERGVARRRDRKGVGVARREVLWGPNYGLRRGREFSCALVCSVARPMGCAWQIRSGPWASCENGGSVEGLCLPTSQVYELIACVTVWCERLAGGSPLAAGE